MVVVHVTGRAVARRQLPPLILGRVTQTRFECFKNANFAIFRLTACQCELRFTDDSDAGRGLAVSLNLPGCLMSAWWLAIRSPACLRLVFLSPCLSECELTSFSLTGVRNRPKAKQRRLKLRGALGARVPMQIFDFYLFR